MRSTQLCGTPSGYQRHRGRGEIVCDDCRNAYNVHQRQYREANPEQFSKYERKRYPKKRKLTKEERREAKLAARYGITSTQHEELFEWQGRSCACCQTREEHDRERHWQVDHDHISGNIRGIICTRDNRLLAQCGDTAYGVAANCARMLAYLAASGDQLDEIQTDQLFEAIRQLRGLYGIDEADPDRPPRERHEDRGNLATSAKVTTP